jgi:hypothetical protein
MVYATSPPALRSALLQADISQERGFVEVEPWGTFHLPRAGARPEPTNLREYFFEYVCHVLLERLRATRPRRPEAREDEFVIEEDGLVFMPPEDVTVLDNNAIAFPQREVAQIREFPPVPRDANTQFVRVRLLQRIGQSVQRRRADVVAVWAPKGETGPRTWVWLVSVQVNNGPTRLSLDERIAAIWKAQLDYGDNRQQVHTFIASIKEVVDGMINEQLAAHPQQ